MVFLKIFRLVRFRQRRFKLKVELHHCLRVFSYLRIYGSFVEVQPLGTVLYKISHLSPLHD